MQTIKDFFRHPIIQLSLAAGASIIILAWVSKRVLDEPMREVVMAIPPFLITFHTYFQIKHKGQKIADHRYWVAAIFISTIIIILLHF